MSRVVSFSRIASAVVRSRAFRALLMVAAAFWGFDKLIYLVTERSFFASVGLESWFWRELGAQVGLFCWFFGIGLGLTQAFLAPLTRATFDEAPRLRGVLARLAPLRTGVTRLAWTLSLLLCLVSARDFAAHALEWIFLRGGARSDFISFGLSAALWTHFLPVFAPFLLLLWEFSLALGVLLLTTGLLRALPLLAAHNAPPSQLSQVLWRFGAYLWLLRAALYATQILELNRGRAPSTGDLWLVAPFLALGAAACAWFCAAFLRRAAKTARTTSFVIGRAKSSKMVLGALAALFLPAILTALSAPIRAFLPETAALKRQREAATRAAWHLDRVKESIAPGPLFSPFRPSIEQVWPVWDESFLLASRGGAGFRGSRVVTWKSATLGTQSGKWRAILAGENASDSAWNASREADKSTSLALERLELREGKWVAEALPTTSPLFFGLEGHSLFGNEDFGISLRSFMLRWAWAWRLRDLFLPVDAATSPQLLTFRGARERAQRLAPFLRVAGEPQLVFHGSNPVWTLELCAATTNFPGAPALSQAESPADLVGVNAVSAPLQMQMDARSGNVRFVARRFAASGENARDAVLETWHAAFPEIRIEDEDESETAAQHEKSWAGSTILRAQAAMSAQLRGETGPIYGPQTVLGARDAVISHVLVTRKNSFEVWQNGSEGPVFLRGKGDLNARLERIDAAIAQSSAAESQPTVYQVGTPLVWPDARAPGGFWVARGFFATPSATSGRTDFSQIARHGPFLWRVALGGIAENARVGVATSLFGAWADATGNLLPRNASSSAPLNSQIGPKIPRVAPAAASPEVLALRTHEALQNAVRRGDWKAFGTLAARQSALLKSLAARHQNRVSSPMNPTR